MDIKKRCIFCRKELRADGYCKNKKCVDYARTKIVDAAKKEGK